MSLRISQSSLATTGLLIKEKRFSPCPPHWHGVFLPLPRLSDRLCHSPVLRAWLGREGAEEPLSRLPSYTCCPHPSPFLSVSSGGLHCLMWWSGLLDSKTAVGPQGWTGVGMDSTDFFLFFGTPAEYFWRDISIPASPGLSLTDRPKLIAVSGLHWPEPANAWPAQREEKWDSTFLFTALGNFTLLAAGCCGSGKWAYAGCWEWKTPWKKTLKFITLCNSPRLMQRRADKGQFWMNSVFSSGDFLFITSPVFVSSRTEANENRAISLKTWNCL